jgi:predicted glycogen debranching enzyme
MPTLYSIETRGQLHPHLANEWLLTNGLGSFSSSTIVACNTRRYHGLLCAATLPPVGRVMALNRVAEMLVGADGTPRELAVNQFNQTFHPRGDQDLNRFELDPRAGVARWHYEVAGTRVVKEIHLAWMRNLTAIRYTVEPPQGKTVQLRLQPFVSLRDFHSLIRDEPKFDVRPATNGTTISRDGHTLHLRADAATFEHMQEWWHNH